MAETQSKEYWEQPQIQPENWEEVDELRQQGAAGEKETEDQNLEQWREGAAYFQKFWDEVKDTDDVEILGVDLPPVRAMFLKEKPMVLISEGEPGKLLKKAFESQGYEVQGRYIYDPEQTQQVVKMHPDAFAKFGTTNVHEIIHMLTQSPAENKHQAIGLLLGYPADSVERHEKANKLQIGPIMENLYNLLPEASKDREYLEKHYFAFPNPDDSELFDFAFKKLSEYAGRLDIKEEDIPRLLNELEQKVNTKTINVYGVYWTDYGYSAQSKQKQKRLKEAFEKSGILNTL